MDMSTSAHRALSVSGLSAPHTTLKTITRSADTGFTRADVFQKSSELARHEAMSLVFAKS